MLWLILSIFSGLSTSSSDLFGKKALENLDEYILAFSINLFALPFIISSLFLVGIPSLDLTFWFLGLASGCIFSTTSILYMKAIKISPLSLSVPMLAFTPLLLLITSPLMIEESPSSFGLIGILLIVIGTYVLSIKDVRQGYLGPLKALLKEKGALMMLFVAILYSISANIVKIGVEHSSPFIFPLIMRASTSAFLLPVMLRRSDKTTNKIHNNFFILLIIGLFNFLTSLFSQIAMKLGMVPYVISLSRTSILFSTLYGYLFFKERRIKERMAGASTMFLGILIISLS